MDGILDTKSDTLGERIQQAMELHPRAPESVYGRLTWLKKELENVGVDVALETVRKWVGDETIPRPARMTLLAKALRVDEAWLALGQREVQTPTERREEVRKAGGSTLLIAALIEMSGGHVAFPEPGDGSEERGIHLRAIIAGSQRTFTVALAPGTGDSVKVAFPPRGGGDVLLAVMHGRADSDFAVFNVTGVDTTVSKGARVATLTKDGRSLAQGDRKFSRVTSFRAL